MFLRRTLRKKDGKQHRYWSVVENRRVAGGRVVQKHLLYLGEINDSQELAWRKSIEILDEGCDRRRTLALFPEDRCDGVLPDAAIVRLKLSDLRLCRGSAGCGDRRAEIVRTPSVPAVGSVLAGAEALGGVAA